MDINNLSWRSSQQDLVSIVGLYKDLNLNRDPDSAFYLKLSHLGVFSFLRSHLK